MFNTASEKDFENPPEKTPEEKKISAIKAVARKNVVEAGRRYIQSRDRSELQKIQDIVNELDDAFVMVIPQKDGVNYTVTFNPNSDVPDVPEEK